MRNWTLGIFGVAIALSVGQSANAFQIDNEFQSKSVGQCFATGNDGMADKSIVVSAPFSIFAGLKYVGGSEWSQVGSPGWYLKTRTAFTKTDLAACLGVSEEVITYFIDDGADGTFKNETLIGFGFVLSEEAGGFAANKFHTFTIGSGSLTPPPSSGDDAKPVDVSSDAVRQLASKIAGTQRLVREGRNRFIQSRRQMRGDNAGISSRNMVDFEFDGTLNAKNGRISSKGSFFQQDGNFEGTSRRVFFGDFDIQRSGDTGSTTATLSGKMAWEHMLSEQNMVGYYIGADMARSNIKGTYFGDQNTYGVSVGTYFVSALQENLFLDGFASLGVGKNDLALANGTVDLSGDYNSRTVTLGAALTGVIKQEGYEIWPELAFTYGKTRLGTLSMTDSLAAVADNNVTLDAGDISVANLTLRPEFRLPMDGLASVDSISLFTFAPRLLCEQLDTNVKTKNCGGGAEFGIDRTSEDGLSRFVARIKADRIVKVTRSALELKVEYRF